MYHLMEQDLEQQMITFCTCAPGWLQDCMCAHLEWFDGMSSGMQLPSSFSFHIFCVPARVTHCHLTGETITLHLIWMSMICWPVTLVCAGENLVQYWYRSFSIFFSLAQRAKKGSRSVGFFTKGSTRVSFFAPDFSQKYPDFSQKYPDFSQNVPFFLKMSKWQKEGRILK